MRSRVLPSLPTTWPTRFSSCAICWLAATISLKVSAIFPARPVQEPGRRTEKSPSRMVCRLARMTLRSALPGISLPRPLFSKAVCDSRLLLEIAGLWSLFFMLISKLPVHHCAWNKHKE